MWAWLLRLWGIASIGFLITGYHSDNGGWMVHSFAIVAWIASEIHLYIEKRKSTEVG